MQVRLRARAARDIDDTIAYYRATAGAPTSRDLVDALEATLDHVSRHPLSGSLRFAFELEIPELRCWGLGRFPYLLFYVITDEGIEVWRVLHTSRDLPGHLE